MTTKQAEKLFYDFGEVLKTNNILYPENYSSNLRTISRTELRRAIMLWVAKQKFDGKDILHQNLVSTDGKTVAILELATNTWLMVRMFQIGLNEIKNGTAKLETDEDFKKAAKEWDVFQNLVLKTDANEANYWENFITKSQKNENQKGLKLFFFGFGFFGFIFAFGLQSGTIALISALSFLIWYIWETFLES